MRKFLRNDGLSVVVLFLFLFLFLAFLAGQSVSGHLHHNGEQAEHRQPPMNCGDTLVGGDFLEATFENRQSGFLAVGALVLLSIVLREKDSAPSKEVDRPHGRTAA